jgi:acyl-CoA synthetase (AMP-forming)/AMP-acid ligase II
MKGLMQDRPLLVSTLISHAARNHGDAEIVSRLGVDILFRYSYAECEARAKKLARALARLGVSRGDRVATLAWNTHRHLEIYYAVSGSGAICHTINPRLFFEQIQFICNHAQDAVMLFDLTFVDQVSRLASQTPSIKHWIALCERSALPTGIAVAGLLSYEELIEQEDGDYEWPQVDEYAAASLCYTSGTTGDPKGVLYTHRSAVLHTYAAATPDCFGLSSGDVIMPASSMYHANAWGVPYVATMVGAKLVLCGQHLDGPNLYHLIEGEAVTQSMGVPTVWLGLMQYLERTGRSLSSLKQIVIGGAACPLTLIELFRNRFAVDVVQLWGMTETSPLGTVNRLKRKHAKWPVDRQDQVRSKQGRVVYGCDLEIFDARGIPLPHDGKAFGNLMIRGWWVASGYYRVDGDALTQDGWFPTGDIATLDPDGYMRITDRSKDVIKSGGEWISSVDLENEAVRHPEVAEAAVIGVPHPKWDERPLLLIVPKRPGELTKVMILDFLVDKVARWWLPDDIVFVSELPHTATGKILKTALREQYAEHMLKSYVG